MAHVFDVSTVCRNEAKQRGVSVPLRDQSNLPFSSKGSLNNLAVVFLGGTRFLGNDVRKELKAKTSQRNEMANELRLRRDVSDLYQYVGSTLKGFHLRAKNVHTIICA